MVQQERRGDVRVDFVLAEVTRGSVKFYSKGVLGYVQDSGQDFFKDGDGIRGRRGW